MLWFFDFYWEENNKKNQTYWSFLIIWLFLNWVFFGCVALLLFRSWEKNNQIIKKNQSIWFSWIFDQLRSCANILLQWLSVLDWQRLLEAYHYVHIFPVWAGIKNEKFKVKDLKDQQSKQFDCFDFMNK